MRGYSVLENMHNMGIASLTPNTQTNTGRAIIPPPNPATPAIVKPMVVATHNGDYFKDFFQIRPAIKEAQFFLAERTGPFYLELICKPRNGFRF
ncbi:MAG: hypothetical protein CM1200mP22_32440 [Dehalococcoidia bacterium]|nr:MAG: hypothetical protein CM1200mP22_32440 [Dehalococcoidia bacterium]